MGKSQAQKKTNDIDDIFAKKAPKQVDASATKTDADSASKSKSQMVKEKTDASQLSAVTAGASVKKKQKKAAAVSSSALPSDDTLFTDLKGTKKRKTTEEGFKIYDDEELRIDPNAGNTDDCPFDCQCCF